eukprot:Clim_evm33s235 gene=Clim_evmTU33s235
MLKRYHIVVLFMFIVVVTVNVIFPGSNFQTIDFGVNTQTADHGLVYFDILSPKVNFDARLLVQSLQRPDKEHWGNVEDNEIVYRHRNNVKCCQPPLGDPTRNDITIHEPHPDKYWALEVLERDENSALVYIYYVHHGDDFMNCIVLTHPEKDRQTGLEERTLIVADNPNGKAWGLPGCGYPEGEYTFRLKRAQSLPNGTHTFYIRTIDGKSGIVIKDRLMYEIAAGDASEQEFRVVEVLPHSPVYPQTRVFNWKDRELQTDNCYLHYWPKRVWNNLLLGDKVIECDIEHEGDGRIIGVE